MTWDTVASCQRYCSCCPKKNYVLLAATSIFSPPAVRGKPPGSLKCIWLTCHKKLIQQKQCKVRASSNSSSKPPRLFHYHVWFSSTAIEGPGADYSSSDILQHSSGCSYCKKIQIGSFLCAGIMNRELNLKVIAMTVRRENWNNPKLFKAVIIIGIVMTSLGLFNGLFGVGHPQTRHSWG